MTILNRYIIKSVIQATALIVLVLIGLIFLINFLGELRDIEGDYTFFAALTHVILSLPHSLYEFFPMLVLLGGVLSLGMLASNQELMVMRASGVSIRRIARSVIFAALILIAIAAIIGEGIAPKAMFIAESQKKSAINGGQAIATAAGVWIHEGNNFLHIDQVVGHRHLTGVTRYEFDDHHQLLASYYAKALDYENKHWHLHDLVKTTFQRHGAESQFIPDTTWNLVLSPNLLNVGLIEPNAMSLKNLREYSQQLVKNGLQASRFQLEFWKRIFLPLTTIAMILLAIPFVFGAPRSVTMGWRILFGITLGFIFYIFDAFFGQFSLVFQISPIIAALIPTTVAFLSYFLLWRLML